MIMRSGQFATHGLSVGVGPGIATPALAVIISLDVDREADLLEDGTVVLVTVSVNCTPGESSTVTVDVYQSKGRLITTGSSPYGKPVCDGSVQVVEFDVYVNSGLYKSGPATAVVHGSTFEDSQTDSQTVTRTIQVHK
jgi:hypothetical protein